MSDDDLDVNLSWPVGEPPADRDSSEATPAAPVRHDDQPHGAPAVPGIVDDIDAIDAIESQVRAVAVRLDALTASTDALRASLEDRLDTYADLAAADAKRRDDAVADLDARLRKAEEALVRVAMLVEVVIDTMPGSAEGSG